MKTKKLKKTATSKNTIKRVKTRKYYYHLTDKRWKNNIILKPRANGDKRDKDHEPSVPRICVSSSVEGCFVSIYLHDLDRCRIYRTKNKVTAVKPFDIPDSHITEEHWLDKPTEFVFVGELEKLLLEDIIESGERVFYYTGRCFLSLGDGTKKTENWQKKAKAKIKKIINDQIGL